MNRFAVAAVCLFAVCSGKKPEEQESQKGKICIGKPEDCPDTEADKTMVSAFNTASDPLRLATLGENEPLWGDHRGTVSTSWVDVPAWMNGFQANFGKNLKLEPTTVTYQCPLETTSGHTHCELFVFQYKCESCDFLDGGLAMYVASLPGWTSFRCAPKFRLIAAPSAKHPMIGFRMVVPAGTVYELETQDPAEFAAFAMNSNFDGECEDIVAQADCEDTGSRCEWDQGVCHFRDCKAISFGPGPQRPTCADACVAEEYAYTPMPYA